MIDFNDIGFNFFINFQLYNDHKNDRQPLLNAMGRAKTRESIQKVLNLALSVIICTINYFFFN